MLNLNLLPPRLQDELRQQRTYLSVRSLVILAVTLTLLSGLLIGGANSWLGLQTAATQKKIDDIRAGQGNQSQTLEQAVDALNQKSSFLVRAQRDDITWAERLSELVKNTSNGIRLNSLTLDAVKPTLSLVGVASTRDALIAFQDALNNLDFVDSSELPIASLAQQRNITFTLTAKIHR